MRILIVGINYAPEPVGIGPYTSATAEALAEAGHEVEVLTGKPYYPAWKIDQAYSRPLYYETREGGVCVIRCPLYVPGKDSGAKRIIHHASFAMTMLPKGVAAAMRFKPQVVLVIAPSLVSAPFARLIAAVSGARLWLHIQDFEVEAAFATNLLKPNSTTGRLARWFETVQLCAPDKVSTISPQMCAKLREKGVAEERIIEFRNWAEIDAIRPIEGESPYRREWSIEAPHVALYSGNIAHKQGIEIIIEAARLLRHRKDIVFVICGQGPNRANLEQLAVNMGNVRIHNLQPRERLGELLSLASVHLLPQIVGAADLVLPSKLANMLASGRPVVATAAMGTGLASEVNGVGRVTPPGDAHAFAAAIEALIEDHTELRRLGVAARKRAELRWSREALLAGFLKEIEALGEGEGK